MMKSSRITPPYHIVREAKLLLPVVVFFVCLIMNPEYASVLLDTDAGRIMLGTAIAMDLMGMAMIKKIVNIKV